MLALINLPKIKEISREYFENDESVKELVVYLSSDEFSDVRRKLVTSSEIEDIITWARKHGVDINYEFTSFSDEVARFARIRPSSFQQFSVQSFAEELSSLIKVEEINALVEELLNEGNDLAQLYLILKVGRPALEKLFEDAEIQQALRTLAEFGIDFETYKAILYDLFRWN